jgi:ribosomal protein L32
VYSNTWGEVFGGAYGATFWIPFLVILLISILIQVLFLLNLRNLLKSVSPQNRAMNPNLVWLNFIPFFNYAWMVYTVVKIRDSVAAELRSRGLPAGKDPAYGVGMGYAVLSIVGAVLGWATPGGFGAGLAAFGGVMGIASLVLWILYWIRTSRLKNQLQQMGTSPEYQGFGYATAPPPHPTAAGPGSQPTATECPSCGLLPMPDDEFCRSCGLPIEKPEEPAQDSADMASAASSDDAASTDTTDAVDKRCPYCGEAYRPHARYCSSCGRSAT